MAYISTDITNIGDPFVLAENGMYYMYATSSPLGIYCWSGNDLKNLNKKTLVYDKETSFGYDCFWAPEVVKRGDGKYVMHFTAKDRKDGILRTGVAVADNPLGPFKDAAAGKPMFDFGFATIDASVLLDGDKAYLYFVKDCSVNIVNGIHTSQIFVAELDNTLTKLISEPKMIATPNQEWESHSLPAPCISMTETYTGEVKAFLWNEGPSVIKHNNKYYLTYSANCYDSRYYSVGVAEADNPLGPFVKYEDNPIMEYIEGEISGPGHNSFFFADGNLMTAFHCHTDYNKPSGDRRFLYCKVKFVNGKMFFDYK